MEELSKEDFWKITTIKKTEEGYFLRTKTPICKYGQFYKKHTTPEERKKRYLDFYYNLYLQDLKTQEE